MPSPTTIEEFLDLVHKSTVADEKRLAGHLDKMRAAGQLPTDPGQFAAILVRDGLLTHFQAEQLLQGKWRRFSIGKYKVLERLGAGGMGSVYLCEHKLMRRRVALKVLPTAKAEDPSSLERFYREARAVAALDHPNIVRAYDIDQEDKLHFLVMEHVDGSSLQEVIKKAGPMDVLRACHYMRQAAMGLQHAHETAGLVHRDIKPGNILIDRNGIVKILDMGLARFFHDEDDILTKKYDENVLGTADYLAPEQALDSHSVDIRADIYSLGATFYFCLTGKTPFAEGTVAQKLIWHQTRQPKPLKTIRPEIPEGVAAIVERMMAKDVGQRYQMPQQVADALAQWTLTPIAPPPELEMPQFSLAAMGGSSAEGATTQGSRGNGGGDPASASRKVWQVPASPSAAQQPAPLPQGPPQTAPPLPPPGQSLLPPVPQRKTAPPPTVKQAPASVSGPPPGRPVAPAASGIPRTAGSMPATKASTNGLGRLTTAPLKASAPTSRSVQAADEETPRWGQLAEDTGTSAAYADTAPRVEKTGRQFRGRLVGPSARDFLNSRLLWLAGAVVVACLLAIVLLWWALRTKPEAASSSYQAVPILYVSLQRQPSRDVLPTLGAAVLRLKERSKVGGRIILQQDIAEEIHLEQDDVIIESEEGHRFAWKAPPKPMFLKLLAVHNSQHCRIRRLAFEGEGREDAIVTLSGNCSGTTLEDLTLKGFKNVGVWVTNCKGEPGAGRSVSLSRLTITTEKPEQCAFLFDLTEHLRKFFPSNEQIVVRDCTVGGAAGTKVRARDSNAIAQVDVQQNLHPVQIGP
jgi:serine/threonine protein kinase